MGFLDGICPGEDTRWKRSRDCAHETGDSDI